MPGAIGAVLLRVTGCNGCRIETVVSATETTEIRSKSDEGCCTIIRSVSTLSNSACVQRTAVITRNNAKKELQPMVAVFVVRKTMFSLTRVV